MSRFKREEVLKPMPMTCAICGTEGTAYPAPGPTGVFWCPQCSPAWLKSWAEFATKQLLEGQS